MSFLVTIVVSMLLVPLVRLTTGTSARLLIGPLAVAFALRLLVHVAVIRSGLIDYGGDQNLYEAIGLEMSAMWRTSGFHFISGEDNPLIASVAVPCNTFAAVMWLCDGPAPLACTAVVALLACGLCIIIFRFAMLLGANETSAFRLLLITAFGPSFVLHTSDMFKDGFNAILVVGALYLAIGLAKKFSFSRLAAIGPVLWMLWHVRPYMVFMCALPIALAVVGLRRALTVQGFIVAAALLVGGLALYGTDEASDAVVVAQEQFERGSASNVLESNAGGGSGVTFDDGGRAWGAIGPKVAYTLFAPFPWMGGSVTLQLGKLETLLWYFLVYEILRGLRVMWRADRESILLLMLFVVPGTLAYATSMSNVGLIFRQRMPIVMVASLLASVVWTRMPRRGAASDVADGAVPART